MVRTKPEQQVSQKQACNQQSSRIDESVAPFADGFPDPSDFDGCRNHCLRMLIVALKPGDDETDRRHWHAIIREGSDAQHSPGKPR